MNMKMKVAAVAIATLLTGCASKETEFCSSEKVRTLALAGSGFMFGDENGHLVAPEGIVLTVKSSKFTEMKENQLGCKMKLEVEGPLAYVLGLAQTMGSGPAVAFAVSANPEAKEKIVTALKGIDESNQKISHLDQNYINEELDNAKQEIKAAGVIEYTLMESDAQKGTYLVDRIIPTTEQVVISEIFAQLDSKMNDLANQIVAKNPAASKNTNPEKEPDATVEQSKADKSEAQQEK